MHILNVRRYFLDTMVELTGIKSGLAVTISKAIQLLDNNAPRCSPWWHGEPDDGLSLEAGEFESTFIHLLHAMGAIPDADEPGLLVLRFIRKHGLRVPPEDNELNA